jgi:hypothetical protein
VIQYRRLSALLPGAWLGAGTRTDLAVTRVFQTVDPFLDAPASARTVTQLNEIGHAQARFGGIYSGRDRLKMLIGFGLPARLVIRRKHDREPFARAYTSLPIEGRLKTAVGKLNTSGKPNNG